MNTKSSRGNAVDIRKRRVSVRAGIVAVAILSGATASAHVVRGLLHPTLATAFVSSPSSTLDALIPIAWGTNDTGLRVACVNVANTSSPLADAPQWPRIIAVGFELPGPRAGFSLLTPSESDWQVSNNVRASLVGRGDVTLDFALIARTLGIPPGQAGVRGSGTRFCLSGPFPDGFTIEQLINGVVVGFQAQANGGFADIGVWDSPERIIPLYP